MFVDTWYAASAVCRAASVMFGPYAPDRLPYWLRDDAETVALPEPAELARLLGEPRWEQPALFDPAVAA